MTPKFLLSAPAIGVAVQRLRLAGLQLMCTLVGRASQPAKPIAAHPSVDLARFVFRSGSFDGREERYNRRGFVRPNTGNAVWGMRFVWPIKAEYVVSFVDACYSVTIIGRSVGLQQRGIEWRAIRGRK
jgi:hypothetical protein